MAATEHICEQCRQPFMGRKNARFCGNLCRWRASSARKYEEIKMAREKDPEASRRGKANRAKGARAEREVCHILESITGRKHTRNLEQTRDGGGDVEWGPFFLEVKYQKTIAMPAWQAQASESAIPQGLVPAVVYRRAGEPFWVSVPFDVFVTMFDAMQKRITELERGQEANMAIQGLVDEVAPA